MTPATKTPTKKAKKAAKKAKPSVLRMPATDELARAAVEGSEAQSAYLGPPPGEAQPGYIRPPSIEQFANATYLEVGPEIREMVDAVLDFDECADLRDIPMLTVWRRKGRPMLAGADGDRMFAGAEVVDPLMQWIAAKREDPQFPAFVLNLYWLHLDDLRGESSFVHREILERHVFTALRRLSVSEAGVVSAGGLALDVWADVVGRYGLVTSGLVQLGRQIRLWPDSDA